MNKTRNIVLAALLTALSVAITMSPLKMVIGPFSLTPGSHVPTMIAMFINPFVAVLTVIGSTLGFLFFGVPGNFVVALRAASHIIFAMLGIHMLQKRKSNIFAVIVITSLLHAGAEALIVYFLTPILLPANQTAISTLTWIAFGGTLVHHYLDSLITAPVLGALQRAKLVRANVNLKWKI